jgi:hypothetical protein
MVGSFEGNPTQTPLGQPASVVGSTFEFPARLLREPSLFFVSRAVSWKRRTVSEPRAPRCRINTNHPIRSPRHIGAACAKQSRTFVDLAEKLKIPVESLISSATGKPRHPRPLVKGLAKEPEIDESFLNRLAEEVRKDLG